MDFAFSDMEDAMEPEKDLTALPMTALEQQLRLCLNQRPDIRDHILGAEELTQYIAWMARNFHRPPDMTAGSIPVRPGNSQMALLAQRLLSDPMDDQALRQLNDGYARQSEERYIVADYDISVSRMLRYMPAHWHTNSYFEIYYAFSGDCPIYFPNEIVTLRPGTVLIIAPSAQHASPCYGDDRVLVYYMLRASTFDQVFWSQLPQDSLMASFFRQALSGQHPAAYLRFETGADGDIRHLLQQLYREFYRQEPYQAQLLNALMHTFFLLLLRRYEGTARLPRREDFYWKHEFSAILSHIQTHYATVTQQELAQRFHYSQRQIRRIVESCMGMPYQQLIVKLRMEKAASLLRQGCDIPSVSAAVGYSTLSSFYRAFTRYYNHPPAHHRDFPAEE